MEYIENANYLVKIKAGKKLNKTDKAQLQNNIDWITEPQRKSAKKYATKLLKSLLTPDEWEFYTNIYSKRQLIAVTY